MLQDLPQSPQEEAAPPAEDTAVAVFRNIFATATRGELGIIDLISVIDLLRSANNLPLMVELYRVWLANTASPLADRVWFDLAGTLSALGRYPEAEQAYRQVLELDPGNHIAAFAIGLELERQKRPQDAVQYMRDLPSRFDTTTPEGRSLTCQVLNNLGRLLDEADHFPEALQVLERSLRLNPHQPPVISTLVTIRQYTCTWPIFEPVGAVTSDDLVLTTSALSALSAFNDPNLQLHAARQFLESRFNVTKDQDLPRLSPPEGYRHDKLRIGYLSSDFRWHALSLLIVEMLELHDRSRVEIYGFCWTNEEQTEFRYRVIGAMNHYIQIGGLDDAAAARCIREHEIDVLVDLHGLATNTRPGILSHRPAPIQATYLGFPGSTGHPAIDYVIADDYVLPPELQPHFTEKPLHLPTVFQVSDRKRPVAPRPSRESCGLPEDAFVFCSFCNTHKITEEMFTVWMSILRRSPGSVFWLLADNKWAEENMIRRAGEQGVERSRLIFTWRVMPHEYLARYQVADLFLDTFPFNGGTTANDALWMGLPILTCSGRTFASRMAGSLLRAAGLPELITTSFEDYEEKAVALAADRAKTASLRRFLEENRATSPLFDIPRIVRDIEDVLIRKGSELC